MRQGTKYLLIGVCALLLNACASTTKKAETEQGQTAFSFDPKARTKETKHSKRNAKQFLLLE